MWMVDGQEAVGPVFVEDQSDETDGDIFYIGEHNSEPLEEVAWEFHNLHESGHWGGPALQAICNLFTKYSAN